MVEIGAQQLANSALTPNLIAEFGKAFGHMQNAPTFAKNDAGRFHDLELLAVEAPPFRHLWSWVNWTYAAVDVDGSVGSIPLDLNFDSVPDSMKGQYQLVTNYGTTEHIANQLTAFKAIHDLAAVGGVMTHFLPSIGMPNHGLVSYNPKFFWMLARSNEYEQIQIQLLACTSNHMYPYPDYPGLEVKWTNPELVTAGDGLPVRDVMIRATFRKRIDAPFVAPLDVPNDTPPLNAVMRDRYWTLFGGTRPDE